MAMGKAHIIDKCVAVTQLKNWSGVWCHVVETLCWV